MRQHLYKNVVFKLENEMKTLSRQPKGSRKMTKASQPRVPLFSSTWVALFLILRQEFTQSRASAK